jgi:hypothetical protein
MTQPSIPMWLLDIDGVINALARGPVRHSWPADAWTQHVVRAEIPEMGMMVLPILVAEPVLDFVRKVVASGVAEVRWHSTWRTAAMTDLAPLLDLPPIPISVAPEWTERPATWWKLPAAQRVVASGRHLVWTDDDIARYPGELGDLESRKDALLISPNPDTGLSAGDLDRISAFLGL